MDAVATALKDTAKVDITSLDKPAETPAMEEGMMMEGEAMMMEGGDDMMMEGEMMDGEKMADMEGLAKTVFDPYKDDAGSYDGLANLPSLLLKLMVQHEYFGDSVRAQLIQWEFNEGD